MAATPSVIAAAGICPQGLAPGAFAPGQQGCTVQNEGTGMWEITADDPSIVPGNSGLMLSPGSGSNVAEGIAFGQSQQTGNVFSYSTYRNDTGAAVDVESQFMIVKFPPGS